MPTTREFGCGICFQSSTPAAAWKSRPFAHLHTLVDDSHFGIQIMRCQSCDQRCVKIFMEWVDWANSDDAQCWIVIPLTHDESLELIARGANVSVQRISDISANRQYLWADFPTGGGEKIEFRHGPAHIIQT
jgi:hypothetical protein